MHAHGAPLWGARDLEPGGSGGNRAYDRDDYTRLFLQASPIAEHLPQAASRQGRVSRKRLELLSKLAVKLTEPAIGVDTDNPWIPAGYTYLAQFAAHDLTFNLTPFDDAKGPNRVRRNARHARLVLQTLYGMGPTVHPHLYNTPELGRETRGTLRLGQMRSRTSRCPVAGDPWTDLPRIRVSQPDGPCPYNLDGNVHRSELIANRHDTLAADSRNDDNVLVSQITVLFAVLHNAVYNRLDEGTVREKLPAHLRDPRRQFQVARDIVTLTYRRVLFHDLLKRLLDPAVYDYFVQNGPLEPDPDGDRGVPLEFSHAAYRIGHAMVRAGYDMNDGVDADARTFLTLNDSLALGSQRMSQELPLVKDWYAQWSKFFVTRAGRPQFIRRIGPSFVPLLGRTYQFPNTDGPDGSQLPGGLAYRDLVRGEEEGLMSPYALAGFLAGVMGPDFDPEAYVKDMQNQLVGWLSDAGFAPEEILELAGSPPLTLFVLMEAWMGPARGCRLGPVGSLIIGEVFFRSRDECLDLFERDPLLHLAAEAAYGGAVPSGMTDLVAKVAEWAPLEYRPLPII